MEINLKMFNCNNNFLNFSSLNWERDLFSPNKALFEKDVWRSLKADV